MAPNLCTSWTLLKENPWYKRGCSVLGLFQCSALLSLQAVLKFSVAVVDISGMNFRDKVEVSMITCCLADGQILAFSIQDLLNK